jgi:hypothetical protein
MGLQNSYYSLIFTQGMREETPFCAPAPFSQAWEKGVGDEGQCNIHRHKTRNLCMDSDRPSISTFPWLLHGRF